MLKRLRSWKPITWTWIFASVGVALALLGQCLLSVPMLLLALLSGDFKRWFDEKVDSPSHSTETSTPVSTAATSADSL